MEMAVGTKWHGNKHARPDKFHGSEGFDPKMNLSLFRFQSIFVQILMDPDDIRILAWIIRIWHKQWGFNGEVAWISHLNFRRVLEYLVGINLTVPLDSHWRIKSSVENDKEWGKEEGRRLADRSLKGHQKNSSLRKLRLDVAFSNKAPQNWKPLDLY